MNLFRKSISVLLAVLITTSMLSTLIPVNAKEFQPTQGVTEKNTDNSKKSVEANVEFVTEPASTLVSSKEKSKNVVSVGANYTSGNFTYSLNNNNEATITGYNGTDTELVIPDTIDGYSVCTIGANAFSYCTGLNSVNIPNSVTSIGSYAFSYCTGLKSIDIPNSVTNIGGYAFYNCDGLTNIFIPKSVVNVDCYSSVGNNGPFKECDNLRTIEFEEGMTKIPTYIMAGCSALEKVIIPNSVTSIGSYAFASCTGLKSIVIPNSVINIGSCAFYKCISLSEVVLSNSVTKIENQAFLDCVSLQEIRLPKTLNFLGNDAFGSCSSLTTVNIPKNITFAWAAFSNCTKLYDVTFEEGINNIPEGIFVACYGLSKISIPDSVTTIKSGAFQNCTNLEKVYLPDTITSIGKYAFSGCDNATIYCSKYSKATIILIDNGLNVVSSNDKRLSDTVALNDSDSYFTAVSGNTISFTCNYSIKDSVLDNLSNTSIKIKIPTGATLADNSLYLDKVLCTDFTSTDDYIQIPVSKKTGKITFSLEINSDCKLQTYAILNYKLNGTSDYDIIDVINEDIDLISLNTDDVTSTDNISVSGIAPAEKEIDIYVDNAKITTLKANKIGSYSGNITIPNAEDSKTYKIKAVSTDNNGNEISAVSSILYQDNAPELKAFTMSYRGKNYDLLNAKKQTISFAGGLTFKFTANYTNPEMIGKVVITSTRNQVTKKMIAVYDEKTGLFVVDGYFDNNNHNYVPGKINITYTPKADKDKIKDTLENELDVSYDDLSDEWKNADVTIIKNTDTEYEAEIKLADEKTVVYSQNDNVTLDELNKLYFPKEINIASSKSVYSVGAGEDAELSTVLEFIGKLRDKFGKNVITNVTEKGIEEGATPTALITEDNGRSFVSLVWDSAKEAFVSCGVTYTGTYFLQQEMIGSTWKEAGSAWGVLYGIGKPTYDFIVNDRATIQTAENDIRSSQTLSDEQKEYALERVKQVEWGYAGLRVAKMACAVANFYIAAHCGPLAPVVNLALNSITGIAFEMFEDYLNDSLDYFKSGGQGSLFNWAIDPSGYIYAGVTSNRINDATVTAYWIPFDDEVEDFWDNPDESKALLWEANEYSQDNPITTDADGNYAWDVPEGWWKVVVEKEGYNTYTTDWLPVPPPQTDVNINLISTEAPTIDSTILNENGIVVTFSQYMDPVTLQNMAIKDSKGQNVEYTLKYSNNETDETGNVFAKEFTFVFDASKSHSYSLDFSNTKNYCGTGVSKKTIIVTDGFTEEFAVGDVNQDGKVDIEDAKLIQKYLVDLIDLNDEQIALADTTADGKVNIRDVTQIQKHLANMVTALG